MKWKKYHIVIGNLHWFSNLNSEPFQLIVKHCYLYRLALSNAADVFPNYNSVKYQAQETASRNYSYTITLQQGQDFTLKDKLRFKLNGVPNSIVAAFTDGSTENLVGSVSVQFLTFSTFTGI